jgi:hypothetical protein
MRAARILSILMLSGLSGCGGTEAYRKDTFPVTGTVTVDGAAPGSDVQVECHPVNGMDTEHPSISRTSTDADGKFSISTYESGDGVPAGDYLLTFMWQNFNLVSREYSGPDKLNGRYSDSKKSEIRLRVSGEGPTDMGVIALTTK